MEWYNYLACFFAGAFLANAVPHFVYGISGDKFPTPFAKPPGKGLSSATTNVIWGLFNFIVGFLLFNSGNITTAQPLTWVLFFAGAAAMSVMLSNNFQKKDKE
jgi:uncharacterized membrane protein